MIQGWSNRGFGNGGWNGLKAPRIRICRWRTRHPRAASGFSSFAWNGSHVLSADNDPAFSYFPSAC